MVFRALRDMDFLDGEILPMAFHLEKDVSDGRALSVEWDRYATAAECLARPRRRLAVAVAAADVGQIRGLPLVQVGHRPEPEFRAHSHIFANPPPDSAARTGIRDDLHRVFVKVEF